MDILLGWDKVYIYQIIHNLGTGIFNAEMSILLHLAHITYFTFKIYKLSLYSKLILLEIHISVTWEIEPKVSNIQALKMA